MQSQSPSPLLHQRDLTSKETRRHSKQLFDRLIPMLATQTEQPPNVANHLLQVREQILTGLLQVGVVLGTLALLVALSPAMQDAAPLELAVYFVVLLIAWVAALRRRLDYRLRAGVLVAGIYMVSCTELMYYGFSQDASILFMLCSLLALLFFNQLVGCAILTLSVTTLASMGTLISTGRFIPLAHPVADLSVSTTITTCLLFVMIVGSIQTGVAMLLDHLELAWQQEYRARRLLEDERDQLEQRVVERTGEIVLARDQALEASRAEAAQNAELEAFAHTVAHDLTSPLAGILGHSQLLLEMQELMTPQETDESLHAIARKPKNGHDYQCVAAAGPCARERYDPLHGSFDANGGCRSRGGPTQCDHGIWRDDYLSGALASRARLYPMG